MTKFLLLIAAVLMFTACKSRKVLNSRSDSTVVDHTTKTVQAVETKVDTGKIITKKTVSAKDHSTTTVEATPAAGKPITINNDGSITGEFTNIKSTTDKHRSFNQSENTTDQKGESINKRVDSTVNRKKETKVAKKLKDTQTKPDYSWIWWLAAAAVGIILIWRIYKKLSVSGMISSLFK